MKRCFTIFLSVIACERNGTWKDIATLLSIFSPWLTSIGVSENVSSGTVEYQGHHHDGEAAGLRH